MEKLHMNSKYKKTTQTYRIPNDKIHEYKLEYIEDNVPTYFEQTSYIDDHPYKNSKL